MKKIDPRLKERLKTLISSMGYEFIGAEVSSQGRHLVFRIYIDKPPQGVNLDDCSKVSHQVSAMLDVEDPIPGRYSLEVSSPGMDRPLFEVEHFRKYIGCDVKIKLYEPINQRRSYKGLLQGVEGEEEIILLAEGSYHATRLLFSMIEKANLVSGTRSKETEDKRQKSDNKDRE